jgi:hypothetical protein
MKNRVLAVFAVLMTGLALVGFSYAMWTSAININGTATMGTIDLQWYTYWIQNETTPHGVLAVSFPDVYTCTITLTNVYPGYRVFVNLVTKNAGSIPLRYYSFQMISWNNDALAQTFNLGFCAPVSGDPFNVQGTFYDYRNLNTYDGWGIPREAVALNPGATHNNLVGIWVPLDIAPNLMGTTFTATFQLTATTYTP